jgi:hypothetical protein
MLIMGWDFQTRYQPGVHQFHLMHGRNRLQRAQQRRVELHMLPGDAHR